MWPASRPALPSEFYFVAPINHHNQEPSTTINFDHHSINASNSIGVIPLLTAQPTLGGGGMQLWQHQQAQDSSAYLKKPLNNADHINLVQPASEGGGGSSTVGTTTCQDCGNQAKKDCPHNRCRTCCKSRAYDCTTHVKSTWVPAARRRDRQRMAGSSQSQSTSGTKKPRVGGASQTTTTASHTSTSSSSHQDANLRESLPGQVRAPAVFKCVRVTAVDDGDDEYAYQAVVRIGGHVFKGFLYDQGFEGRDGNPDISELQLGGVGGGGGGGRNGASSALDPSDIFAASSGGLLGGSSYGTQIN